MCFLFGFWCTFSFSFLFSFGEMVFRILVCYLVGMIYIFIYVESQLEKDHNMLRWGERERDLPSEMIEVAETWYT